jgi:release factor glutamine methyltransferase
VRTVADALAAARAAGVDRLDAQLLLAHGLGRPRAWLIAHDDAPLDAGQAQRFAERLARRAGGEPLAYLVGEREFHGLVLCVDARVLVPRPETELIVDWALELLAARPAGAARPRVADLGTGSGAIALAIAHGHPAAEVTATDIDPDALAVAAANAARHGIALRLLGGAWWAPLAGERFDLVVSNPPYIAAGDAHLAALGREPQHALVSGVDGLDALRAIAADAPGHLQSGGWLLLEHGATQAPAVAALLAEAGLRDIATRHDLAGLPRCTGGRR